MDSPTVDISCHVAFIPGLLTHWTHCEVHHVIATIMAPELHSSQVLPTVGSTHFACPSTSYWIPELFPLWDCYEWRSECLCVCVCVCLHFSWVCILEWSCWATWQLSLHWALGGVTACLPSQRSRHPEKVASHLCCGYLDTASTYSVWFDGHWSHGPVGQLRNWMLNKINLNPFRLK
jgi:hypothetical protein